MLLPLLFVTAMQAGQAASPSLTLNFPGSRVEDVLVEVSKETKQKYVVSRDLADDVVAVRVSNAKPQDFLPRLAQVLGAEWREANNGLVLVASPAAEKEEQAEMAVRRVAALKRTQERLDVQLEKFPVFDEKLAKVMFTRVDDTYSKRHALNNEFGIADALDREKALPIKRLLARMVKAMPEKLIGDLAPDTRVVYTDSPNSIQSQIPRELTPLTSTFIKEEQVWETAQKSIRTRSGADLEVGLLPPKYKVELALSCSDEGLNQYVEVQVVDPAGKVWLYAVAGIEDWNPDEAAEYQKPPIAKANESRLDEGEPASSVRRLSQYIQGKLLLDEERSDLLSKAGSFLRDPEKVEPLSLVPGALWTELSKQRGENLIAHIADTDFSTIPDLSEGPRTPTTALLRLLISHKVAEQDGWLTIRPKYNFMGRRLRLNRPAAADLIRSSVAAGGFTIEDAAAYVARQPQGYPFQLWPAGYVYAKWPHSSAIGAVGHMIRRDELQLYGTLDADQQAYLRRGPLNLRQIPKVAALLSRLVYVEGWASNGGRLEATDAFPNGVPNNAVLRLIGDSKLFSVQPFIRGVRESSVYRRPYTPEELGAALAAAEGASRTQYRTFTLRWLNMRLEFAPGISYDLRLEETIDLGKELTSYDQLPASFRARVEKARKSAVAKPTGKLTVPP